MVTHPCKPTAFEPKPDQGKPDTKRLALDTPRTELIATYCCGQRIADAIWAACVPGLPGEFQFRRS